MILNCSGIFVTWKTIEKNEDRLRGCIGCLSPVPLSNIERYARARSYWVIVINPSAFEDPRFSPIRLSEVKRLQCTVSLLYDFEDANDPMDWEVKLLFDINLRSVGMESSFPLRNEIVIIELSIFQK